MGRRSIRRVRGGLGKLRGVRPLRFWARRAKYLQNLIKNYQIKNIQPKKRPLQVNYAKVLHTGVLIVNAYCHYYYY